MTAINYLNMFERIVRKDGSVIILLPQKETKAVTFELLYKVGSRLESKKINGISHFVEHLMFKGTKRRPQTIDISKELDSVGAEYNAFTGKEYTGYYITADNMHLPLTVDMLSDMVYNSQFDAREIERERGVIVEEINMYEDNPMMYIEDVFESLAFSGSSLGPSIAGPRKNILTISRRSLLDYYRKYYYNGNVIFGLAGKFDRKRALKLINQLFPPLKRKNRVSFAKEKPIRQRTPRVDIIDRQLEQVQLMLGFRGYPSTDKRYVVSQVLANILGGNMSSRLFINIRERQGLCYFIRSSISGYQDMSTLVVHAGLNKLKIFEALQAVKNELEDIAKNGVDSQELKKAKDNLRGRMILKMESAPSHLNFLLSQEILGQRVKSLEQRLKELENISPSELKSVAQDIIRWPAANLAIIGPFKDKKKFLDILKNKN